MTNHTYAHVLNGVVDNMSVGDPTQFDTTGLVEVLSGVACGIGYTYDGKTFTAPSVVPVTPNPNIPILGQIAALESQMGFSRTQREMYLKLGATAYVIQQDAKVVVLRGQLK